jgi:hypothetical protein
MGKAFLSKSEIKQVFDYCEACHNQKAKNALKAFLICCHTGFSLEEIQKLKFQHIKGRFICRESSYGVPKVERVLDQRMVDLIGKGLPHVCVIRPMKSMEVCSALFSGRDYAPPALDRRVSLWHARKTYQYYQSIKNKNHENIYTNKNKQQ